LAVSPLAGCSKVSGPDEQPKGGCAGGKCDVWGFDDRHELYEQPKSLVDRFTPAVAALVSE
jgi:hypothetical protein